MRRIDVGNVAVTMLQLSNIAWEVKRELKLDTSNGKIVGDAEAMQGGAASTKRDGSHICSAGFRVQSAGTGRGLSR